MPTRTQAARLPAALALLALAGCELPSELPKWDTTWVVPGETTSITIESLLPGGVSLAPGGTAFQVSFGSTSFGKSLGELCPSCSAFNGLVVPKPEFTATAESTVSLPGEVVSATLSGGQVPVQLQHDFSFDPLRPSSTARGYAVITVSSGSILVAKDSISGNDTAFPANTVLNRTLQVSAGEVTSPLTVAVKIYSPAGDPIRVDTNQQFQVTVSGGTILASSARVRIASQSIDIDETELDLSDVDQAVVDRVKSGALRLVVDNPFDVTANLNIRITAPGTTIMKSISVGPGESTHRVEVTQAELRSILGQPDVRLSGTGSISTPAAGIVVTPTDEIDISARLELTVGAKEEG